MATNIVHHQNQENVAVTSRTQNDERQLGNHNPHRTYWEREIEEGSEFPT